MIIVRLKGGLGNQMFQYATGRALAYKYDVPIGIDLAFLNDRTKRPEFHKFTFRDYGLDIFNIKAEIISQSRIPFIYRQFLPGRLMIWVNGFINKWNEIFCRRKYFYFDKDIFNKGPNAYLNGNWQSYKYFSDINEIIRQDFTIKNELSFNIKNLMEVIKNENSLCVHVRRGDYVGNKKLEIVGDDYYERAITTMKNLTTIDKMYVFSDDIKWCEENMKFNLPVMFVGTEYAGEKDSGHLALMMSCKNFIITNSTFSWWAAWLAEYKNKVVISPACWSSDLKSDTGDLIPKEWIKI